MVQEKSLLAKIVDDNNMKEKFGATVAVQQDTPSRVSDFYFDIIKGHTVSINNQITDYYLENNTAVQDHIAHAPLTISLSGLSGEVVYTDALPDYGNEKINKMVENIQNKFIDTKLTTINALIPSTSNSTQLAKNLYNYINASAKRYIGIVKRFQNDGDVFRETRLQAIYRKLMILRNNNTSLLVHTPYGDFTNMYIQSITLRQNEENYITDIEMTLKQLNFANVKYTDVDKDVMAKYNAWGRAREQENGKTDSDTRSVLAKMADGAVKMTGFDSIYQKYIQPTLPQGLR